ncbi:hypothetical protein DRE_00122 [Drechslerella stenobrocha 248]|uniref:Beta-xylanase n=1 Tax=Drechslerella stenobrocha 248 TaxID=1043628 RepID=W7I9P9_9PEZI|nr:hypothetical protein DRE_00122 [Drechslerella stenobrocha 248]
MKSSAVLLGLTPLLVSAQQSLWGQCGGIGYTGPTNCVAGAACTTQNAYYAQCVSASGPQPTTARTTTTAVRTTTTAGGQPPAGTGLDALIKSKGKKYVGFATDQGYFSSSDTVNILKAEGGSVTAENSMKWDATEPSRGGFNWNGADALANFATQNGKQIRGHTLLWHAQLPQWVKNINDKATLTTVIQNHAAAVAGRYKGKVYAWDVANEVVGDGGGMRSDSIFTTVFRDWTFLDVAFRAAKAADPGAKLCLNDYNIDFSGAKLNTFVQVVKDLKSRGVPIDCVGTQTHTGIGSNNIANFGNVLNTLASTGTEVQITELDIAAPSTSITSAQLTQQRADYKSVVSACMRTSACTGITLWGVSDRATWITGRRPLLWDENFAKKPAYQGFVDGINS